MTDLVRIAFGIEAEISVVMFGGRGERIEHDHALNLYLDHARQVLCHVAGPGPDCLMLENGGKLYRDAQRIEICTPEVDSPAAIAAAYQAIQFQMLDVERSIRTNEPKVAHVRQSMSNVCYSTGHTAGFHDNYSITGDLRALSHVLMAHAVSSLPLRGAGGFDARMPMGQLQWVLSPRACFISELESKTSQHPRGILDTYHHERLHTLYADGNMSPFQVALRVASTALVLSLASHVDCSEFALQDPLAAWHAVNRDPDTPIQLKSGVRLDSFSLQEKFIQRLSENLHLLPQWADDTLQRWSATISELRQPNPFVERIDWTVLRWLFGEADQRWHDPACCQLGSESEAQRLLRIAADYFVIGDEAPFAQFRHNLDQFWDGDNLLAATLAKTEAPSRTRARLRAEFVRNHCRNPDARADWDVLELADSRAVLADVWQEKAELTKRPSPTRGVAPVDALRLYDRGEFVAARSMLQSEVSRDIVAGLSHLRHQVWIEARLGEYSAALELLSRLSPEPVTLFDINQYVFVYRHAGIVPHKMTGTLLAAGARLIESSPDDHNSCRPAFLAHWGHCLVKTGEIEAGVVRLRQACRAAGHAKLKVRVMLDLVDGLRLQGDRDEAATLLCSAQELARSNGYRGDTAIALLSEARLFNSADQIAVALEMLSGNDLIGTVRGLLLSARLDPAGASETLTAVKEQRKKCEALRTCVHLDLILANWNNWTSGEPIPGYEFDHFAGV